jgi:uncharacterized membrane protein
MIISTLLFYLACFVILLILIPIGTRLVQFSKGLSAIFMLIVGALSLYLIGLILKSLQDSFVYKWYHFIGLSILIGAMNNANLKGEATKDAQFATTFLFSGFV